MVGHELPGKRWGLWDISSGNLQVDVIAGDFRLIKEVLRREGRKRVVFLGRVASLGAL
jgi:hypothetical protein